MPEQKIAYPESRTGQNKETAPLADGPFGKPSDLGGVGWGGPGENRSPPEVVMMSSDPVGGREIRAPPMHERRQHKLHLKAPQNFIQP